MKEEIQKTEEILENLDQSIISVTKNGVGYCNKLGLKIFDDLKNSNKESINDQNFLQINGCKSDIIENKIIIKNNKNKF